MAGNSWMRVVKDRVKWNVIGEAYAQQWASDDDNDKVSMMIQHRNQTALK